MTKDRTQHANASLNREERRRHDKHLKKANKSFSDQLVELDLVNGTFFNEGVKKPEGLLRAFRSKNYLVQVFSATDPCLCRLSINRTQLAEGKEGWMADIPWEDLQTAKSQCGYYANDAVEVFPHDLDVVNITNMRHLWIMKEPLSFAWRRDTHGRVIASENKLQPSLF